MSNLEEARPVATGNWGCGAFRGNKELKSWSESTTRELQCPSVILMCILHVLGIIQMLAAAEAKRAMIYCTFNDREFESYMIEQYEKLIGLKAIVGEDFSYNYVRTNVSTRLILAIARMW